jgi:hypothetical protein
VNYGNVLPVTGGAGVLLAGHFFGLDDIIAFAIVVVLAGIAAYRYGSRIDRGRTTVLAALGALVVAIALLGHLYHISWPHAVTIGLVLAICLLFLISDQLQRRSHRAQA